MFSDAWMANKKVAGGMMRGTSARVACFLNEEINPARHSQLAAAVSTEQHQNLMETACGGDKATARG